MPTYEEVVTHRNAVHCAVHSRSTDLNRVQHFIALLKKS
jgi:hypothetical protein